VQECLLLVTEVRPGHRSGRRQYALRYVGPDDQILEVLAKPVKLPDDEDVAGLDGLETSNKARVVVVPEGRKILGEAVEVTPCGKQSVALWHQGLAAVALREQDVTDKHVPTAGNDLAENESWRRFPQRFSGDPNECTVILADRGGCLNEYAPNLPQGEPRSKKI
jgi:hypothetical protein